MRLLQGIDSRAEDGFFGGQSGKIGMTSALSRAATRRSSRGWPFCPLKHELGDLDRVSRWVRVLGMFNPAAGFVGQALVIDGFTDLMIELYGEDSALCPRSVAGMAELPFNSPVLIEGEATIDAER